MSENVLTTIAEQLIKSGVPLPVGFVGTRQLWGELIQLYRDYVDGNQRMEMPQEVADLLMVDKTEGERFTFNYCELIMQRHADRIKLTGIRGIAEDSQEIDEQQREQIEKAEKDLTRWADRWRRKVRFDALQIDNHEDTITAGDSFVMVDPTPLDPSAGSNEFCDMIIEPAYNGSEGIIPVYDLRQRNMVAVIKIWESHTSDVQRVTGQNTTTETVTEYRVTIYYPDRVEKYMTSDGKMVPFTGESLNPDAENSHITPFVSPDGKPLGVPFVPFKDGGRSGKWNGKSIIKTAIPANDVLNNGAKDMTLISNLTAALIRYVIGAEAPDGKITPGMIIEFMGEGVPESMQMPKVGAFEMGTLSEVIAMVNWAIEQMSNMTDTPLPNMMGSSASSGESLKQREIGFVARANKRTTKWGNSWEDVFKMSYRFQEALGTIKPPKGAEGFDAIWMATEIRNDVEIVDNAIKIAPFVDRRTVIEEAAKAESYGWDSTHITKIIERLAEETEASLGTAPAPTITPDSFAGIPGLDALGAVAAGTVATGGVG